jgi:hypothetical protein
MSIFLLLSFAALEHSKVTHDKNFHDKIFFKDLKVKLLILGTVHLPQPSKITISHRNVEIKDFLNFFVC